MPFLMTVIRKLSLMTDLDRTKREFFRVLHEQFDDAVGLPAAYSKSVFQR
jgi:hypothetical protein